MLVSPKHSKNQYHIPGIFKTIHKNTKKNEITPVDSAIVENIFFYLITIRIAKWEIAEIQKQPTTMPCQSSL